MHSNHRLKFFLFNYYAIFSVVAGIATFVVFLLFQLPWAILLAIEGGIISFTFAVQKQRLEEVRLFKELFKEFNERYDKQNDDLNCIYSQPSEKPLSSDETKILFNYFNLCGEEYLYFKRGFIYPEVWHAWKNGMTYFRKSLRIKKLWDEDLEAGSYYGLSFDEL